MPHLLRPLIAMAAITGLVLALVSPAVAAPQKTKKLTQDQLLSLLLTPAEGSSLVGFTGALDFSPNEGPACLPLGTSFICREVFLGPDAGLKPRYVAVAVYPTVKEARAALGTLPGIPAYMQGRVASRTPNEIVFWADEAPGSAAADEVGRVAVAGRFLITTTCTTSTTDGAFDAMRSCATALANTQAGKLSPFQPKPAKGRG